MLGCVLYTLAFYRHPFVDCQKLGIVNARFFVPAKHQFSQKLVDLIRHMLTPDPAYRPSIFELQEILKNWDAIQTISLNKQAYLLKKEQEKRNSEISSITDHIKQTKYDGQEIPMKELMELSSKLRHQIDQ